MFGIGATELVVIFVVALLFLGPKRLPELARNLGRALGDFRRAASDIQSHLNVDTTSRYTPPPVTPPAVQGAAEKPAEPEKLQVDEAQAKPAEELVSASSAAPETNESSNT